MVLVADLITADDWITEAAFEDILKKTCRVIRDRGRSPKNIKPESIHCDVRERARYALNETVAISIQNQFRQVIDQDKIKGFAENAAAALKYFQTVDWLNSLGFEYATADLELRRQIEGMVESFKSGEGAPRKLRRKWWEDTFFPETLGLYAALFQERPTSSFNPDTKTVPSAALVFLREITIEVKVSKNADALFFASEFHSLDMDEWSIHSESALRNKINRWLKVDGTKQSGEKLWQENCQFFETRIWQNSE